VRINLLYRIVVLALQNISSLFSFSTYKLSTSSYFPFFLFLPLLIFYFVSNLDDIFIDCFFVCSLILFFPRLLSTMLKIKGKMKRRNTACSWILYYAASFYQVEWFGRSYLVSEQTLCESDQTRWDNVTHVYICIYHALSRALIDQKFFIVLNLID